MSLSNTQAYTVTTIFITAWVGRPLTTTTTTTKATGGYRRETLCYFITVNGILRKKNKKQNKTNRSRASASLFRH